MKSVRKVNLAENFKQIHKPWSPRIAAELNDQYIKLARFEGTFQWHRHDNEDEAFLVVQGHIVVAFRDRTITVGEGELLVIPRGIEHRPASELGAWVVLFEPKSTLNTGDQRSNLTLDELPWTEAESLD